MKKSDVVAKVAAVGATVSAWTTGTAVVGGGMATGAIITAAAPVLAAGAVLYGLCRLFED